MSFKVALIAFALIVGVFAVLAATAVQASDDGHGPAIVDVSLQAEDADEDNGVWVQSWTVVAVAGAAAVGLLAFMVRATMGWVKPPPPKEESPH